MDNTIDVPENQASRDRAEVLTERIAARLRSARLETPALFLLEAHLPFVTIAHTLGLLLEPMALPLFGADRIAALRLLLSDRANIELLIRKLDHKLDEGSLKGDSLSGEQA